jgi:DNA-binding response OmpR family regulator
MWSDMMNDADKLLIISTDPLVAALLGAWAELERYRPVFDQGGESPQAAVERHRPALLLVDVEHRDGASDEFLRRQREAGRPVVLYGSGRTREDVRARAERHGLGWLVLPADRTAFADTLAKAVE